MLSQDFRQGHHAIVCAHARRHQAALGGLSSVHTLGAHSKKCAGILISRDIKMKSWYANFSTHCLLSLKFYIHARHFNEFCKELKPHFTHI